MGSLGTPTKIEKKDTLVVCVGVGIGVASLHHIVEANKKADRKVITIIGARNRDLLINKRRDEYPLL